MQEYSNTVAVVAFLVAFVIYFLPSFIAGSRNHPNTTPVVLLNTFLGWTLLGWVAALVWSASSIDPVRVEAITKPPSQPADKYTEIERIAELKEKGVLSEAEFEAEKTKLLNS